jgi:hypothetical protein
MFFKMTISRLSSGGELYNYCSQTFVVLDKWLNQIGTEKGDEALQIVKDAIENNVKANIAYYENLAKEAEDNGLDELAAKHKLLARLYKGLLK